jgi:hypothetical protein
MCPAENTKCCAETVNEFCDAMRLGRTLFYKEVGRGRIKILKAGSRKTLVPISEREAYLQRLAEEAAR